MVSRSKQLWYCFGACSEGGDIFKFVMKMEGLEFLEALKLLADKAGVVLPKYDRARDARRNVLLDIVKTAVEIYARELNSPRGNFALEYLKRRGLDQAVTRQFALGYAPDTWDTLTKALLEKFKPADILASGVVIKSERNQGLYDRFRHRLMFPICDIHGNPVGFTSRILDETRKEGKYVNTPETLIYSKGKVLYGLNLAREAIRAQDCAMVVEGNMDVIACHQFGIANVVASSGTALTIDQARLLKRYTQNLKIAFDADPAGQSAARRGIDVILQEGMRVKIITFPEGCGKDPDECIRKSKPVFESAVLEAREIMEYYITRALGQYDIKGAEGQSKFANLMLREILKVTDLIEQDFWLKRIAEICKADEKVLRAQLARLNTPPLRGSRNASAEVLPSAVRPPKARLELLSERILAIFLLSPQAAADGLALITAEMLAPQVLRELYTRVTLGYNAYNSIPRSGNADLNFRQFWRNWAIKEPPDILSTADILELLADKEFEGWSLLQLKHEAEFIIEEVRREYTKVRRAKLREAMSQAERFGNHARAAELAREFNVLQADTTNKT